MSSDASSRASLPWGLIGALLLLGAWEGGLRVVRPEGHVGFASGAQAYRMLPHELRDHGAADVVVVGSSRAREATAAPRLQQRLTDTGSPLTAANYTLSAGRAAEVNLFAHQMVRHEPRPKLVLYGVEPRQLLSKGRASGGVRTAMRARDYLRIRWTEGRWEQDYFGFAVRNSLSDWLWTFRYEHVFRAVAETERDDVWAYLKLRIGTLTRREQAPMLGNHTRWQIESPRRSGNLGARRARSYLRNVTDDRPYVLDDLQGQRMHDTVATLRGAGVDVVLWEIAPSEGLAKALPKGVLADFQAQMRALADTHDVRYVDGDELAVRLKPKDRREHSHLNLRGANKTTDALFDRIVAPWLEQRQPAGGDASR